MTSRLRAFTTAVVVSVLALAASPVDARPLAPAAFVRVNLVGYVTGAATKQAFVLSTADLGESIFTVQDSGGGTVLTGTIGADLGPWNARYPFVFPLDIAPVNGVGTYAIHVRGPVPAVSPPFRVASATALYGTLLANARLFFEAQRDGPDVIGSVLKRQPSHLNDEHAAVYLPPVYRHGSLHGDLRPAGGGPVDASGGWFDAGDYLKFVETASYTDALMLAGVRDFPSLLGAGSRADLTDEGRFGTDWLLRMWDGGSRTLRYQVGIGDGNGCGSICGDHDLWRLPQADDAYGGSKPRFRYIRDRPVFRAGPAGEKVSPNLAGRMAASFALCSQVFRASDPAYADRCLTAGEGLFALADTSPKGQLLTASPHGYYPESQWRDDLELGATELSVAVAAAGGDGSAYLRDAAHWAAAYLRSSDRDSLNLYDVSGLAHAELFDAITEAGDPGGLDVTKAQLLGDLKAQLVHAEHVARSDPFGPGFGPGADVVPHVLGLVVTAAEVDRLTGSTDYAAFGRSQAGFVLGANAWGSSFVIGAGAVFPDCPQHQVANLVGSPDGSPPVLLGAVPSGPNDPSSFRGLGLPSGANRCPPAGGDPFKRFTGHGSRYEDDVVAWPSVEPADDYTAVSILAFADLASGAL